MQGVLPEDLLFSQFNLNETTVTCIRKLSNETINVKHNVLSAGVWGLTACPDLWVPYSGSCYYFSHDERTFTEAAVI